VGDASALSEQADGVRRLGLRRRLPTLVLALGLRLGDSLALPLEHDLTLELGERGEHVQHQPARCAAGVHGAAAEVEDSKRDAFGFQGVHQFRKVPGGAGQPVKLRYDQRVAIPRIVQSGIKLLALRDR
jgi:hypothetical protein